MKRVVDVPVSVYRVPTRDEPASFTILKTRLASERVTFKTSSISLDTEMSIVDAEVAGQLQRIILQKDAEIRRELELAVVERAGRPDPRFSKEPDGEFDTVIPDDEAES